MVIEVAALLALTVTADWQEEGAITLLHDASPAYNRVDYEAPCGSHVFRVRFQNGPDRHGRVEKLTVDRRPVPGAAEHLQLLAARRPIERVGIMNCGSDLKYPVFRGVIEMSEAASRVDRLRPSLYFRLRKQADGSWLMFMD